MQRPILIADKASRRPRPESRRVRHNSKARRDPGPSVPWPRATTRPRATRDHHPTITRIRCALRSVGRAVGFRGRTPPPGDRGRVGRRPAARRRPATTPDRHAPRCRGDDGSGGRTPSAATASTARGRRRDGAGAAGGRGRAGLSKIAGGNASLGSIDAPPNGGSQPDATPYDRHDRLANGCPPRCPSRADRIRRPGPGRDDRFTPG